MARFRFTIRQMMTVTAVLAPCFALSAWFCNLPPGKIWLSPAQIHSVGVQLVDEIEAWRTKHGQYPGTIEEAGLTSRTSGHRGFRYEVDSGGFLLQIGIADGVNEMHVYTSQGYVKAHYPLGWSCMD